MINILFQVKHVGTISDDDDSIQMISSSFPSFLLSDNRDIPDPCNAFSPLYYLCLTFC